MHEVESIGFRPLTEVDLPLIFKWLQGPEVARWWRPDSEWPYETFERHFRSKVLGDDSARPYLILLDGGAIGYIQVWLVDDEPEAAAEMGIPNAAGVDLFIGDPGRIHTGLGAPVLRRFMTDVVFTDPSIKTCIIDPDPENHIAIRAYEKAGFRYVRTTRMPGQEVDAYLMRVEREEVLVSADAASSRER